MRCPNLTQETITRMREMRAAGMSAQAIATKFGCSRKTVSQHTKNMPGLRKRAKDEKLRARWREIQASYQDLLRARKEKSMLEKGMRPCEHCRWRMDGAREIVCLRYCDLWGAQRPYKKKAPAHGANMDRRTAPNEADI